MGKMLLLSGSLAMALAVMLGAFGAHGLRNSLTPDMMNTFETGVKYHFYHALGLMILGLAAHYLPEPDSLKWAGWLMGAGIIIFSGSLYLLSIFELRWMGAITPVGGLCFIASWLIFAYGVFRNI